MRDIRGFLDEDWVRVFFSSWRGMNVAGAGYLTVWMQE